MFALLLVYAAISIGLRRIDEKHKTRLAQINFFSDLYRKKFREMVEAIKRGDRELVEQLDQECEVYAKRVRET